MADDKKLFTRTISATPATSLRIAFGKDGVLTLNMTFAELFVYLKANISYDDTYLNKGNTDSFTPTLDYHPATKKYVDDTAFSIDGVVANTSEQGWTELAGGMRLQWFKFISSSDSDQVVPFPYPFPNACVSVILGSNADTNVDIVKTANSFTFDRDGGIDGDRVIYCQAIGY